MLTLTRAVSGGIFVIFGAGKFINHASELSSFQSYGLPWPATFVDVIGVLELAGGLLLIVGLYTRPAALLLAGDMIGAIAVSGIGQGETISLTLAPALLVATVTLVLLGPGRMAADVRLHRARESAGETPAAGPGVS
jgi:putative oxidoreductase